LLTDITGPDAGAERATNGAVGSAAGTATTGVERGAAADGTALPTSVGFLLVLAVDGTAPPFGGAAGRALVPAVDGTAPPFGGAAGRALVPAVERISGDDVRSLFATHDPLEPTSELLDPATAGREAALGVETADRFAAGATAGTFETDGLAQLGLCAASERGASDLAGIVAANDLTGAAGFAGAIDPDANGVAAAGGARVPAAVPRRTTLAIGRRGARLAA
jgi:hypothetical protein